MGLNAHWSFWNAQANAKINAQLNAFNHRYSKCNYECSVKKADNFIKLLEHTSHLLI